MDELTLQPKRKRGRPSKKDKAVTDTGEHWADRMIRCYKEGYSDVEICSDLEIPYKEFERRIRDDALFAQLVEIGRLFSKAFWFSQARTNLKDRSFNMPLWYAVMKNRFGWADKAEISTDDKPMDQKSDDEIKAEILTKYKKPLQALLGSTDIALSMELLDGLKKTN